MWRLLANRTYRHLLSAHMVALIGTGLATVALALLAFQLAGNRAGAVLGTALGIRMVASIVVGPVAAALIVQVPRRTVLVGLDLLRACTVMFLPFVTEIWQIYVLIFMLQASTAAFTPAYQAVLPDILPDEQDYTRALSFSRLAQDLESLVSPLLAAALLTFVSFNNLFVGTAVGFIVSGLLILTISLPGVRPTLRRGIFDRTTVGIRIYLKTPRLRGLLALSVTTAAAGAMVSVNTVVLVNGMFGLDQQATAFALMAFGCGSMIAAFGLPRLLARLAERSVMLAGGSIMTASMLAGIFMDSYGGLLVIWLFTGGGYSMALTPIGRLIRLSANAEDLPALFAAQFALAHIAWLFCYPLSGWVGTAAGIPVTFAVVAVTAGIGLGLAFFQWPANDQASIEHTHHNLPPDHPHLGGASQQHRPYVHSHVFVIDAEHPIWPAK